jgi:hypothetical protein
MLRSSIYLEDPLISSNKFSIIRFDYIKLACAYLDHEFVYYQYAIPNRGY